MDISNTAVEWARAEAISSSFFVFFGLVLIVGSFGFWQFGGTDIARAYIIPMAVTGVLLLILGVGLLVPSLQSVSKFPEAYTADANSFIASEIERVERVMNQYRIAVFIVIPLIITTCALAVVFISGPHWRASFITTIAMLILIMIVDTNANARLDTYKNKLLASQSSH